MTRPTAAAASNVNIQLLTAHTMSKRSCTRRLLLKDDKGLLSKEGARSIIDGSVFQKLADEREKRLQRKRVRMKASIGPPGAS
jgi:Caleosin related protein